MLPATKAPALFFSKVYWWKKGSLFFSGFIALPSPCGAIPLGETHQHRDFLELAQPSVVKRLGAAKGMVVARRYSTRSATLGRDGLPSAGRALTYA